MNNKLRVDLLVVVEFIEQLLKAQVITLPNNKHMLTDISIDILSSIYDMYGKRVQDSCRMNDSVYTVLYESLMVMKRDTYPDGDQSISLAADYIAKRFYCDGLAMDMDAD